MSRMQKGGLVIQPKKSVFIEDSERSDLSDLLDFIEHKELAMAACEEKIHARTKDLLAGCFRDVTLELIERVRDSGIEDALMLDPKHPDFEDAHVGISSMIALKNDIEKAGGVNRGAH